MIDPNGFDGIIANDLRALRHHAGIDNILKGNLLRWFSPCYGSLALKNLYLWHWRHLLGFRESHMPNSYLKSTFAEAWAAIPRILEDTSKHRFRNCHYDVNQWLMRYWQLSVGKFHPRNPEFGQYYSGGEVLNAVKDIKKQNHKVICINDSGRDTGISFEECVSTLRKTYQEVFPDKSTFELY